MERAIVHVREAVLERAARPEFVHHEWFGKWHLELVVQMCDELLASYPEADPQVTRLMAWLHDYGKMFDFTNQYHQTQVQGRALLLEAGVDAALTDRVLDGIALVDAKLEVDLHAAPIEVQIVSSADAASHHVGPFMPAYWREHPELSVEALMESQAAKTRKDWARKMVLPEVRSAMELRHGYVLEQAGLLPRKFFS